MMKSIHLIIGLFLMLGVNGCGPDDGIGKAPKAVSKLGVQSVSVDGMLLEKIEQTTKDKKNQQDRKKSPKIKIESVDNKPEIKKAIPKEMTAPELHKTEGISLSQLVVAKGVEDREPKGAGDTFELGDFERIYAFLKVENPDEKDDEVTVAWAPVGGGRERGKVQVSIGPQKRWRTWAFTRTIEKPGQWEVLVRNSEGDVIGRAPFEVIKGAD